VGVSQVSDGAADWVMQSGCIAVLHVLACICRLAGVLFD